MERPSSAQEAQRAVRRARALVVLLGASFLAPFALAEDNGVHAVATLSATPPINAAGWAKSDVTVTLACNSGAANCHITYRLDRATQSTTYTAPFTVSTEADHVLVTSTSPNGNAGFTSDTFRVRIDKTAPAVADHADVSVPRTGESTTVTFENPTATDALSGLASLACSPASGSAFTASSTTVTCTGTDVAGNSGAKSFQVILTTTQGGALPDLVGEATSSEGAVVVFDHAPCTPASGSTFPLGATTVDCPQEGSSFIVRVVDTTAPGIAAHADVTAEATSASGAVVSYTPPSTSDLVDGTGTATCSPGPATLFPLGATTVTCQATDARGNVATPTTFKVTVSDTLAPTIDPVADITATATNSTGATVTYASPATLDNVAGAGTATCSPRSGTTFKRGTTAVTCTSSDATGNSATRQFNVVVVDATGPVIAAHANVTAEAANASGVVVNYTAPTWTDESGESGTATCSPASGALFAIAETVVTCSAADTAGNTGSTTFTVRVLDTTPPVLGAKPDVAASATTSAGAVVTFSPPSAHDLVDGARTPTCSPASGSTFALGSTLVTCAASDTRGNSASTTFRVSVSDTTAPVLAQRANVTAEATSTRGAQVSYAAPAYADDVSGTGNATCAPASGALFPIGATLVTCTATDAAGNVATSTFHAHVVDTTAPTLSIALDPATPQGLHGWYTRAPFANVSANDSGSGVNASSFAYSLDGANWTPGATFSAFPQNASTFHARASDAAGNVGFANVSLQLDSVAPTVVSSDFQLALTFGTLRYNFSEPMNRTNVEAALANASGWIAAWDESSTQLTITNASVEVGAHQIVLGTNATDAHGARLAAPFAVSFRREAPHPLVFPPDAPIALAATLTDGRVRLGWSAPERDNGAPVTRYRVSIDGREPVEIAGTYYEVGRLARGAVHRFAVTAVNSAGESAPAEVTLAIPPVSTLRAPSPDGNGWHRTTPTVDFAVDPADATVLVDTGAGPTPFAGPFGLREGEVILRWHATAGGVDEAERVERFLVDTQPPALSGIAATGGSEIEIHASAADGASGVVAVQAIVTREGGEARLWTLSGSGGAYATRASAEPGAYSIEIVATDAAGHEARASAGSVTIVAPLEPIDAPPGPEPQLPRGADAGFPIEQTSVGDAGADPGAAPTSEPQESAPAPEPEIVFDAENFAAGVRGTIVIRLTNVDNVERVRFVLVLDDGSEIELASGTPDLAWDTTSVADGYYTIEARRGVAPPGPGELSIRSSHETTIVSARVLVRNEIAPPVAAAGAVVGAVLVTAATQTALSAAAGAGASSVSGAAGGFDPFGFAQEVAIDAGQDKLKSKTRQRDRQRRVRSVIAGALSLVILAPLWAFSKTDGWSLTGWIPLIPVVGLAAALVIGMKYGAESALALSTGARPRVRIWIAGTLSLIVSAVLFRNPFGYPAYVDEQDESEGKHTWRMQAGRALATIAGSCAFILPFLLLAPFVPWTFTSIGILLAITNVATSSIPFGPLPGRDVWRWNKLVAVIVAIAGFGLYVAFAAALAPVWTLWTVALAGGAIYAASLLRFRQRMRARAVRVPVQVAVPVRTGEEAAPQDAAPRRENA